MDYQAIKREIGVEKAARFLQLDLKPNGDGFRCFCPACDKDRVLIVTPSKAAFYCHNLKKGGDVIYLVAHVRGIKQSEAATLLQDTFMREPEKPKAKPKTTKAKAKTAKMAKPPQPDEYSIAEWLQQISS
jgi:CHC2 zinc finger